MTVVSSGMPPPPQDVVLLGHTEGRISHRTLSPGITEMEEV
eukprot:CAMPEP_0170089476 /NCGR_PEP_ID=MMETSP0019_2-20121128/23534_1 /TAXON_ID=98059 /ORGANISM="Dinobryon sp., Strain UTEXLB2267" /LENGTH=40 /DNA_ID= /DNA_START= /DNA_END= /DNA_ORIENTATION=